MCRVYNDRLGGPQVARYWPAFAANGKSGITVAHVLTHKAGLHAAGLDEIMKDPYTACNSGEMLRILEEARPEGVPGEGDAKYHFLTFGWLVEGIVRWFPAPRDATVSGVLI